MRLLIVVPTVDFCRLFFRDRGVLYTLEPVRHPDELTDVMLRSSLAPDRLVLAGLDAPLAWLDNALEIADVLVISEPWLATASRACPQRRARLAARLADLHDNAPLTKHYSNPQLRLALSF